MGGRPPKLANQKTGAYTKAAKKALEDSIPVYQSQNFIAPPTLTDAEKKVWDWLVSIFRETVNCMVSDADVHLMELYCRAKVATDEADAELKKDPRPYLLFGTGMIEHGQEKMQLKANPNIKKRHDNAMLCLKYFNELGLSPLARARAGVKGANAKQEQNIFEKLMSRSEDE